LVADRFSHIVSAIAAASIAGGPLNNILIVIADRGGVLEGEHIGNIAMA
jgi:hypothetical protein